MNAGTATGLLIAFVTGVGIGLLWREAFEILRGRDDMTDLLKRGWARLTGTSNGLAVALIVSMLFTGLVGIYVAVSNAARGDLVTCISDYNQRVGDARDSRTAVASDLADAELDYLAAELDYQRNLLDNLAQPNPADGLRTTIEARIQATEDYRAQVEAQEQVRETKPYPSPTLCEEQQ